MTVEREGRALTEELLRIARTGLAVPEVEREIRKTWEAVEKAQEEGERP